MDEETKTIVRVIKYVTGSIIALILILGSYTIIGAGQRGVKTRLGAVVGVVDQGFHFKFPLIDHVYKIDVQTQKEQADAQAASSDLQTVKTTVAVNYNPVYDKVGDLYQRIGLDFGVKVIDPNIQEVVKAVTAKFTAEELITKRSEVTDEIQTGLAQKLAVYDISVNSVSIVNFDFSESFNNAIEAKVTAEQNALAAKNKLEQVRYEAEQRVTEAKGEAEAIKIQAEAIAKQGGRDYVDLQWIKAWLATGGKMPQIITNDSKLLLNPGLNQTGE